MAKIGGINRKILRIPIKTRLMPLNKKYSGDEIGNLLGLFTEEPSLAFVRASTAMVFFIQICLWHLYKKYCPSSPAAIHHINFFRLLKNPAVIIFCGFVYPKNKKAALQLWGCCFLIIIYYYNEFVCIE